MVGETIGSYKIVGRLGTGGMGEVYRASHQHIERDVAIKVLLPGLAHDREAVARFFGEARATSLIRHAGIIEVLDCAVHTDGRIYIVMELLTGESLAQALDRRGTFADDWAGACALIAQIARAVAAAHEQGIIHRDLKPDNVFLHQPASGGAPQVKVLDFGIAKLLSPKFPSTRQTKTGDIVGTPLYMAPEQCRGHGVVDQRADIYALGCIAYQMLAGRPPFVHEGAGDLLIAHVLEDPPDLASLAPEAPPALRRLVMDMLAKLPAERPAAMAEVARRIEAIGASDGAALVPASQEADRAAEASASVSPATASAGAGVAAPPDRASLVAAAGLTRVLPARAEPGVGLSAVQPLGPGQPRSGRDGRGRRRVVLASTAAVTAGIALVWLVQRQHAQRPLPAAPAPGGTTAATETTRPANPATATVATSETTTPAPRGTSPPPAPAAKPISPPGHRVTINVTTTPPGAEVWVVGESAPRGVTPMRVSLAGQRQPRDLVLRALGYQDKSVIVDGERDSLIAVELQRSKSARRGPPRHGGAATAPAARPRPERSRAEPTSARQPSPSSPYWRMAD